MNIKTFCIVIIHIGFAMSSKPKVLGNTIYRFFVPIGSLISSFMSITMKYDNQKVGNRSRAFISSNELLITNV